MGSKTYIIIIGANRSGSTSLYHYLGEHPEIAKSKIKMVGYFLDPKYSKGNIPVANYFKEENDQSIYSKQFEASSSSYFLEATPDYLYSEGTIEKIVAFKKKFNIKIKLICLIRNPVDRYVSLYKNIIKLNLLPQKTTFESTYNQQEASYKAPLWKSIKMMGFYSNFLKEYSKSFTKNELKVVSFDRLSKEPRILLNELVSWVGLSEGHMQKSSFDIFNKSINKRPTQTQNYYTKVRKVVLSLIIKNPILITLLKPIGRLLSSILFNRKTKKEDIVVDQKTLDLLSKDYKDEAKKLQTLFPELKLDWS